MARRTEIEYVNLYNASSLAYQFEPAPLPKKNAQFPKPRRKKRIRVYVDPMALLGIAVGVVMLVMMISGLTRLHTVQQQQETMSAYVEQLQTQNDRLRAEYEAGYDPDEIRDIAVAMGMIPAEQAQHITLQISVPEEESEPTGWEIFCSFLAGLFA